MAGAAAVGDAAMCLGPRGLVGVSEGEVAAGIALPPAASVELRGARRRHHPSAAAEQQPQHKQNNAPTRYRQEEERLYFCTPISWRSSISGREEQGQARRATA